MDSIQEEGVFTQTGAFNLFKDLIGVNHNIRINKGVFNRTFNENNGFFRIRQPEEKVREVFTANKIPDLNAKYYDYKQKQDRDGMDKVKNEVHSILQKSLS